MFMLQLSKVQYRKSGYNDFALNSD